MSSVLPNRKACPCLSETAFARLDGIVKGKDLRERDKTEMMAFFEAYGATGGDQAVVLLDGLLNSKGETNKVKVRESMRFNLLLIDSFVSR